VPGCFADTSFWIALSSRRDQHHARALAWSRYVGRTGTVLLTTELVLWEWMNALSDPATRRIAAGGYRRCHRDPRIEVVPPRADLLDAAVRRYEERGDKNWSLSDCLSFVLMEQRGLVDALTTDSHFLQAGFQACSSENHRSRESLSAPGPHVFERTYRVSPRSRQLSSFGRTAEGPQHVPIQE